MIRSVILLLVMTALGQLVGCSSPQVWVIMSVQDGLSREPIVEPVLTVTPVAPDAALSQTQVLKANEFGVARLQLPAGTSSFGVLIDARGYDLHYFDLPGVTRSFPSGEWLDAEPGRAYPLRPSETLELMVTIEP